MPKSLVEVEVLERQKVISRGGVDEQFLLYDNKKKKRILLFCSESGLEILSKSKTWHSDGTFHCAAKFFNQLYVIHAYFPGRSKYSDENSDTTWVIKIYLIFYIEIFLNKLNYYKVKRTLPVAWAFMRRRRTKDYNSIFHELKKAAKKLCFSLKPKLLIIDFEQAVSKSFMKYFPDAQVKGCLFHFSQNLFKNLSKNCLKEVYTIDPDLQVIKLIKFVTKFIILFLNL